MKKFLLMALLLGAASQASAGMLLEPYAGYEMETLKTTDVGGTSDNASGTATSLGLRLGIRFPQSGVWLAADGQFGSGGTMKFSDGNDSYTRQQIYVDLGYDFQRIFRMWAGYCVSNKLTLTPSDSSGTDFTGGTAWKVGIGFRLLPKLTLGAEYHQNGYATMASGGTSLAVNKSYSTFSDSATLVTLSFPFLIGM